MSSPGFEASPYIPTVSVANHYTGWATPQYTHTDSTVYLSYAAYCVPFTENRADLMFQNANTVLRSVHRQVWLLPQRVFQPFSVWFARSLMPVLP
ncbi:hypothetical protein TNCV_1023061 [Trichonephila clavipes]|nr:hypothetical protein TNCV_1023061 [Trichonephila clavipes]